MGKFLRIYAGGRKSSGLRMSLKRGRPVVFRPLVTRSDMCYLGSWDQISYLGRTMRESWCYRNVNTLLSGGLNKELYFNGALPQLLQVITEFVSAFVSYSLGTVRW